jgi:dsRNA-specific ribonuclease
MPATRFSTQDQWHTAEITLSHTDKTIQSGLCKAASRKTAEQLAALAILRQLAPANESSEAIEVDEKSAERLRADNAKGKLLELCAKNKFPAPEFTQKPTINGFAVSASVTINSAEHSSHSFRAATVKTAQQAAAEDLLNILGNHLPESPVQEKIKPLTNSVSQDRRPDLNNLRQQGVINDFGYDVVAKEGPDHEPTFTMMGWAKLPNDTMLQTGKIVAEAKKEGALQCANVLWELLKENNFQ